MNLTNTLRIEWLVLRSKKPFWLVLALSFLVGAFISILIVLIHMYGAQGETVHPVIQALGQNASAVAGRTLWVSNLYIIPLLLLLIACDSIASERSSNRLRDCALQPVSRNQLLMTKILSHSLLSIACAALTGLPALLIGGLYFQNMGPVLDIGLAYMLSALGNVAVMALGMWASTMLHSAGFAAISTIILLIAEKIIRAMLQLSEPVFGFSIPESILHFFPGHAFEAWSGWNSAWSFGAISGLIGMTVAIHWLLFRRFQKLKL